METLLLNPSLTYYLLTYLFTYKGVLVGFMYRHLHFGETDFYYSKYKKSEVHFNVLPTNEYPKPLYHKNCKSLTVGQILNVR